MAAMRSIKQLDQGKLNRDGSNLVTGSLNFDLHPVLNFVVQRGPALPGTGSVGQLFMQTGGTPGLYYHDGVSWVLIGGLGLSGTQFHAALIVPESSFEARKVPLDITHSSVFASINFTAAPPNPADAGASVGDLGYEQTLALRQKVNGRITGNHSPAAGFRLAQLIVAASLGPETYTENAVLAGEGGGVRIAHGLRTADHLVMVGVEAFNAELSADDLASGGQIWVEVGADFDTVHNTGIGGVKFNYMATVATINGADVVPNGLAGVPFEHNLGDPNHICMAQPVGFGPVADEEAANLGAYWAVLGANTDMIYCTGGTVPNLKLRCMAMHAI